MRLLFCCLAIAIFFSACKSGSGVDQPSAAAKRYTLKGKIISVDRTAKKAKVEHESIPGYMEAMTMDFPVHADMVWGELKPGAEIRADLIVDTAAKDPYYLENIIIAAAADPNRPAPPINEHFTQLGLPMPDFRLTNQDGKRISIKDFRGRALAITFIYARCPLPEYCIRMSTNFSDLANQLAANDELKDKIRLLSISFDPANDTPEKLKSYGLGYLGKGTKPDFSIWQLAVGSNTEVRRIADFFGFQYEVDAEDKTMINHSLRTAVINPGGTVTRIYPGNEWTPADLLRELEAARLPYK